MIRKLLLVLLFLSFFLFFKANPSYASDNFVTDYNVTYTVRSDALTHVNLYITITNLSSVYFTPSYDMQMGFTDIKNLTASDETGSVTPQVTTKSGGSSLHIEFNRRVVGIGNKHTLTISFDTNQVAQDLNHVWEINIPGLSNTSNFNTFNTTVIYPSFLGKPAYIKPDVYPINRISGDSISFDKNQLGTSGISITFGTSQIYGFNLMYHLNNSNLFPVRTEIALPPSTNYQDVLIDSISPKPLNVTEDADGNWMAQYYLSPSQSLNIDASGKVQVFLHPKSDPTPKEELQKYLKSQTYWESNNPRIIELAKQLKTPEAIYDYVSKNLSYDYSRASSDQTRLGAVGVLSSPDKAVCLEFTDLFIALSRAAGIPAREIDGYAYTQNTSERPLSLVKDILHAWPEYYDSTQNTWIMVDPTWGNTTGGVDYFHTLDFDHFAFVIKGLNSNYPVPAGGYKLPQDINSKDVNVFVANTFNPKPSFSVSTNLPNILFAGFPVSMNINFTNTGNSVSDVSNLELDTNSLNPSHQTIYFQNVPPFGYISIPVNLADSSFLTNSPDTVKITVGNKLYSKNIRILPIFMYKWVVFGIGGVILAIIFTVVISFIIRRSRRVPLPQ